MATFQTIGNGGGESSAKSPCSAIVGFDGGYTAAVDDCGNDIGISLPSGQADDQVIKSVQLAVGAGKVFLRRGLYMLAGNLRHNIQGASLEGEGAGRTILKYKPGVITNQIRSPMLQCAVFDDDSEPTYPWNAADIEISHLTLDGNKANQTVTPNSVAEYTFCGLYVQRGPQAIGTYNFHDLEICNFAAGGSYFEEYRDASEEYPWPRPQLIFRDSFVHHNGLDVNPSIYTWAPGRAGVLLDKVGAGCILSNLMSYENVGSGFDFTMINGIIATGLQSWKNGVGCTYFGTGAPDESKYSGGLKVSGQNSVMRSTASYIQIVSDKDASFGVKTNAGSGALDGMKIDATVISSLGYGVFAELANDLEIDCRVRDCANIGVFLRNSNGLQVRGSSIHNGEDGLRLSDSSHNEIQLISKNNARYGLLMAGNSSHNTICGGSYIDNCQVGATSEMLIISQKNIFENVRAWGSMSQYSLRELTGADYNYYRNILLNGGSIGRVAIVGANSILEGVS